MNPLMTEIAVVILNWNTRSLIEQFLPLVIKYSLAGTTEIWLADNDSNDGSANYIQSNLPDVKIIQFDKNYGFTGGYNRALDMIEAKYYILLNSDVEVTEHWLEPLYTWMENHPKTAACTPKIRSWYEKDKFEYAGAAGGFIDYLGYPFCQGRIFDKLEEDHGQYDIDTDIFWATGACIMIRSEVFRSVGGFDELFFAHMEEIDLCWRMQRDGYSIHYCPQSVIFHMGGGTLPKQNPRKTFLNFRNNLLLLYKNLPPGKALWIFFVRLILDGISGIRFFLRGDWGAGFAIIKAHFAFYKLIPRYLLYREKQEWKKSAVKLEGIFPRSIVYDHFIRKIDRFSDLNWK
jgi:GT2 family glycosyltransferase